MVNGGHTETKQSKSPVNFRFAPCIFKVNHFYWPTSALNCI